MFGSRYHFPAPSLTLANHKKQNGQNQVGVSGTNCVAHIETPRRHNVEVLTPFASKHRPGQAAEGLGIERHYTFVIYWNSRAIALCVHAQTSCTPNQRRRWQEAYISRNFAGQDLEAELVKLAAQSGHIQRGYIILPAGPPDESHAKGEQACALNVGYTCGTGCFINTDYNWRLGRQISYGALPILDLT